MRDRMYISKTRLFEHANKRGINPFWVKLLLERVKKGLIVGGFIFYTD